MSDLEQLKTEAKNKFGIMRKNAQQLFSGSLTTEKRIATRKELIRTFDDIKKIFQQLNKLES